MRISTGTIAGIRDRLGDVQNALVAEAMGAVRIQAVVHVDEMGAPTGNADGRNPEGRFGGIMVSDQFRAYNHLPIEQRQVGWVHLRRDLLVMTQRSRLGPSARVLGADSPPLQSCAETACRPGR